MNNLQLSEIKRILVIKPKPLGDVLMATPVVRSLRRHFPQARLVFLAEPPYTELLKWNPHVDEVISFDRERTGGVAGNWRFFSGLRARRFDLVMDLWCTSRTVGWVWATGARVRVGFNHRMRRWAYNVRVHSHATYAGDINLDCVRALGLEETDAKPELFLVSEELTFASEFLKKNGDDGKTRWVMVAPGAGWPSKRWPASFFASLVDQLGKQGDVRVAVLCGPQDEEVVHQMVNQLHSKPVIVRDTTLRQSASLVQRMRCYIGNDSGPMHLAVALGVPTITMLGPNNSDFISPVGPHQVLRHSVSCSPCNLQVCPLSHHLCMEGISVDTVLQSVLSLSGRP